MWQVGARRTALQPAADASIHMLLLLLLLAMCFIVCSDLGLMCAQVRSYTHEQESARRAPMRLISSSLVCVVERERAWCGNRVVWKSTRWLARLHSRTHTRERAGHDLDLASIDSHRLHSSRPANQPTNQHAVVDEHNTAAAARLDLLTHLPIHALPLLFVVACSARCRVSEQVSECGAATLWSGGLRLR